MTKNKVVSNVVELDGEQAGAVLPTRRAWQKPQLEVKPVGETAGSPGGSTNEGPFITS